MSSNSDDALENWKNRMHEVSFRKCGLIMQLLFHVATETVKFAIYKWLPELSKLLIAFEHKVLELQELLALEESLKATLACLWVTQKKGINGWV